MLISVTFSNLKEHQAYLDYELETFNSAEKMIRHNLQQAEFGSGISMEFWEQQYQFADYEIQRIKKRKQLLEHIYDTLFAANQKMEKIVEDSYNTVHKNEMGLG